MVTLKNKLNILVISSMSQSGNKKRFPRV